jgi:hypothetical protein
VQKAVVAGLAKVEALPAPGASPAPV